MVKRKKKLKQRHKKQLKQRIKQFKKAELVLAEGYLPPWPEPPVDTNKRYESGNKQYQAELDKVYGSTVVARDNFINGKSTVLHYCTECQMEFYAKPLWLLKKENNRHICGVVMPTTKTKDTKPRRKRLA